MSKWDDLYKYVMDRQLAVSPDGREATINKLIKEAKVEAYQDVLDMMAVKDGTMSTYIPEKKYTEDTVLCNIDYIDLGMGDKVLGNRIYGCLKRHKGWNYVMRGYPIFPLKNYKMTLKQLLHIRNMGPRSVACYLRFLDSQDLGYLVTEREEV
jgi:hypothetical protein